MHTLETFLAQHPFFAGMTPPHLQWLAGCASNVRFEAGTYLFREGDASQHFYAIRRGQVALEIMAPGFEPITIETLEAGDVLGWSWLLPPHTKQFDAPAVEDTVALAFDAPCLRAKCEQDAQLGYELLKRFARLIGQRLQATRLQLLDVYGTHP